jgi:hypothetical protein
MLTHESLAQMLGVRSPTVTETSIKIEAAGAIVCSRGVIKIIDIEAHLGGGERRLRPGADPEPFVSATMTIVSTMSRLAFGMSTATKSTPTSAPHPCLSVAG